jgi:Xaa-Pro aminopeptidase
MDRREFFGTTAAATVAGLAAGTPSAIAATAKPGSVVIDPQFNNGTLGKEIPINKQRAYEVMAEHGIDGLIALRTHNVYYITNTVTTLTPFGAEYPSFATFSRDPQQPSFLISSTGNTWETQNGERDVPDVITMGGAANWQEYINATPEKMRVEPKTAGKAGGGFVFKEGANLTEREKGWKYAQETYFPAAAPTAAWAIVKALKQSGLINGRIAVDDMRIAYLLQSIGIDTVKIVDGDNIFRKIRHIKTPNEIALLRVAQKISQDTAMAAARAVKPGMTYADFKQIFFTEGAARGGEPGFVLLGVTQGLLPDGEVKNGKSYLLDCSVHYKLYQGDFARTLMVGEPSAENMKRFKAQQAGREAAFAIIKEGVPFKKVEQVARDAMEKSGMPKGVPIVGLHSVGLQHGDDPQRFDVPFNVRDDLVLQENMTVTLDLPYLEVGQGAGHNEDMLRITKTGYEILNDPKDPLVVV